MKSSASFTTAIQEPSSYGWVMVVIAALAMVATLPGRTHGLGMITERLLSDPDLQIDRLSFSEINFWGTLLGGLFCLPCGWLIDRFGLRITLTLTVSALAVVVLWMTRLSGSREFAVAVMLTRGFGQSALSVISITMVGKWFAHRTSLAMAVYSLLLSLGFAYAAQIAKPWAEADWRVVWEAMGYSLAAFVPVCLIFCRDPRPDGQSSAVRGPSASDECCAIPQTQCDVSLTLLEALRTQSFWVFALATSLVGLIGSGLSLFNESVLTSQGFSKDVFYNLITLTGTVGLLTKLPIGWIGQRWPLNRLLTVGLLLQATCMAALPFVRSLPGITLYGVGMGISGTITTVLFFTIWSRAFGRQHLGQIQSVAQLLTVMASAAGPVIFARSLAQFGSYSPAFMTLAIVSSGFAVWSWCMSVPDPAVTPVFCPLRNKRSHGIASASNHCDAGELMMSTVVPLSVPLEIHSSRAVMPASEVGTRFHLSLNVSSIERVAAFLQLVLGVAPAKQRVDYAKFELDSPPLVLSLEPNPPQEAGSLNHLGFRFANTTDLLNAQKRIEAAGISTQREEGVECCYAKQTKFWVHDPDQRLWEFYVLEGDLEHRGGGQSLEQMVGDSTSCSIATIQNRPVIWEHRMGSEFSLPAAPSDQIRLRGTFNVPIADAEMDRIICEVYSNLKPGGQLELHMLTSESPLTGPIELPGPAAYVKHVPVRRVLMQKLTEAGFVDSRLTTFRTGACFQSNGQSLRETKIVAVKPSVSEESNHVEIVYRGPFAEIRDDYGIVWHRGEQKAVPTARWEELQKAGLEASFTLVPLALTLSSCGN